MKQALLIVLALVLMTEVYFATYNNTLSGSQTPAPEAEGIGLNLTASGDLPGMSKVTLQRNNLKVTGGTWRLTVLPPNADASSDQRGELVGTITGGSLTLTTAGALASASAVKVTIQSGTGEFASVTSGNGTITITTNSENPSQLNGTLVLTF